MDQLLFDIHLWNQDNLTSNDTVKSYTLSQWPMELFHTARNCHNRTPLHGDMTQVHEMGWLRINKNISKEENLVIDAIIFNHKMEVLKLCLVEQWDSVDEFHIFEAMVSHQENLKPLHFEEHQCNYAKYASKLFHHVVPFDDPSICNLHKTYDCEMYNQ